MFFIHGKEHLEAEKASGIERISSDDLRRIQKKKEFEWSRWTRTKKVDLCKYED